jgi:hypothetical protein
MWGVFTRRSATPVTPRDAVIYGAIAGCAGTAVITLLGRIALAVKNVSERRPERPRKLPRDPFNPQEVSEWQDRTRAPAAYVPHYGAGAQGAIGHAAEVTPAGALVEAKGPGPEGAAEHFLIKLGSGLFDRDFAPFAKPAGTLLHFVYGSFGGMVYAMLQGRNPRNVWCAGAAHGFFVWAIGPGSLVPAMRLMLPPRQAPKLQTGLMIAGHMIYGVTVATVFDRQLRRSA